MSAVMAAAKQFTINHLPSTTDRGSNSGAHTPASLSGDNAVARLVLRWLLVYQMESYNYIFYLSAKVEVDGGHFVVKKPQCSFHGFT